MRAHGEFKTRQVVMSADPDCTKRFSTQEYCEAELGVESEPKFSQARKPWTRFSQNKLETEAGGTEGPASISCAQIARPQERKCPSLNARQSSSPESIEDNTQYPYTRESNNASEFDIATKGPVPIDPKPSLGSAYCSPKDLSNSRPGLRSSLASFERASPKRKKVNISDVNGEPGTKSFWIRRRAYMRLYSCSRISSDSRGEYWLLSSQAGLLQVQSTCIQSSGVAL